MTAHAAPAVSFAEPALFIDGNWESGDRTSAEIHDVIDPATETVLGRTPAASTRQVRAAISAASQSFPSWSGTAGQQRGEILRNAGDILMSSLDADATTLSLEQGKPITEARGELASIAELFRWYSRQVDQTTVRVLPESLPGNTITVRHVPVGPIAILTPWNFPASLASRKLAAALAVGCTAVVKPAPETPSSFLAVVRALTQAGLPSGVLNVVNGDAVRISRELIEAPEIRAVSFTGSTEVGRQIAHLAASALTRATLELGGHAPVIVAEDVDVPAVARSLAAVKYRNAGQVCVSPTRILVQRRVFDEFVEHFVAHAAGLSIGPGLAPEVDMGPLSLERRRAGFLDLVERTVAAGATVRCGGEALLRPGWFVSPTVLSNVAPSAPAMNEEPFGPLAIVNPYEVDDDAVGEANRLPVGLAAYVYSASAERANSLAARIDAGMIGVNSSQIVQRDSPVSGLKDSGYWCDGGLEGLHEFQQVRSVSTGRLPSV